MNGFEGLLSIPVVAFAAWLFIKWSFKKIIYKLENSVDKKEFEKFIEENKEDYSKDKKEIWKHIDENEKQVNILIGKLSK